MNIFRKLVLEANFDKALETVKQMKKKEIADELIAISFDSKNMLAYGFVVHALLKNETIKYHWIASYLLGTSFIDLEGAAELAYCHAKRAVEIDNTDFCALSNLLGWIECPDTTGNEEDYERIRQRIAELYPNDSILNLKYGEGMNPEDIENSKMSEIFDD